MVAAAAIAGSAVVGAGASIYGSGQASSAANKAAGLSQADVNFNNLRDQPYVSLGDAAASQLQDLNATGFTAGQPNYLSMAEDAVPTANNMGDLTQTPGYQFNLQQGLQSTQNAAAARGLGVSGAALKGAASYATGLADTTYQNQFANQQTKMQDYLNLNTGQQANATNLYNRLSGTATLGANTAVGAGTAGVQGTSAAGNYLTAAGTAAAAGSTGAANALSSGANNYLGYTQLQNLLGNSSNGGIYPVSDSTYASLTAHPALSGISG